ncbi:primase-helicase family protein [Telluribacter humicola]|uniref:primase-helicase family protein n=1 Tax=Telluribacter humicola TaxID=1720261 RepID=UPI001A965ECE|nr:primase-helicase family protein [Telluribacter humicola]
MFSLTPQDIFLQTNGGLDIILKYYPQAEPATRSRNHKFAIRDEKTPSSTLREYNGTWWVKDFGGGDRAMNAVDIVMKERGLDFADALRAIADDFEIETEERKFKKAQARYERRAANEDEAEGEVKWVEKDWTTDEFKSIFAENIWTYLSKKGADSSKKEKPSDETGYKAALKLCKEYNLYSLQCYSIVSPDKNTGVLTVHTFFSTDIYPILMFNEGQWQKFYKPKERDPQFRFFSSGKKPENYMFGISQVVEKWQDLQKKKKDDEDDEEGEGTSVKREEKLPEVLLCTGGSDALNVAALGYPVVWLNGETATLEGYQVSRLMGYAEKLYNLPDIDETGKREALKIALKYLDIHTIYLPEELRRRRDLRGKACKDIRDYFRYYNDRDFENLLKRAYPLKFWDEEIKRNREGKVVKKYGRLQFDYKPNNELIYNFLYRMGFGLMDMPSEKSGEVLIQVDAHIVKKLEYKHVNRFVKGFLDQIHANIDLKNAFHRSPHFSDKSLANLREIRLPFDDHDRDYQYMFFPNEIWKITKDGIETSKPAQCDRYVWEEEVIPHQVELKEAPFTIFRNDRGQWDITIHRYDCMFLRFAINTSRVFWRKELEDQLDQLSPQQKLEYLQQHRWSIDGPLLSDEEIQEQKQHLISKLISYGYLLHRYKDPANPLCVWSVDYNIENSEDSNGGTGKSMFYQSLYDLMKNEYFDGRNDKLTMNPHLYENISEHTDLIFIDDASKYFNFDFFYSVITGPLKVNPKGTQGYTIPFSKSPKLCITSNFPPKKNDKTTRRRLWFTAFSDYYHKNPNGEYREERTPIQEFGKSLFREFSETEWNLFLNTAAYCCRAWMQHGQVEPPMESLMMNQYKNAMGETFHAWADAYFSEANKRLDRMVPHYMALETYKREGQANLSSQGFNEKLRNWCYFKGYTLNPPDALNTGDKRIVNWLPKKKFQGGEWVDTNTKESVVCIYIQTDENIPITKEVSDDLPF